MKRQSLTRILCILCIYIIGTSVSAQDTVIPDDGAIAETDSIITGRLDNRNSREVYFFEGARGEVIRLKLRATSGNLDPVLTLIDNTGQVILNQDDYFDTLNVDTTVTLDDNMRYYVVVGRYGYDLGTTIGDYELLIERVGTLSVEGSTLQLGIPVINTITSTQPVVFYTFRANEGDIVDIDMVRSSGTLDPFLQIADRNRFVIATNDDKDNSTRNAGVQNLLIEETGTYIIIATRYGEASGDTAGSFVLSINEADGSGLGNNTQAPAPIVANTPIESSLTDEQFERFYVFEALRDDLITVTLDQTSGVLDAYLEIANAGLQVVASDDDSGSGRNARIENFRIPATGVYYIIASRFDKEVGDTSGNFRLQLVRNGNAFDDVPLEIPRLLYGTTITDEISNEDSDSLFVFWGEINDVITINMNRANGNLDSVLELLNFRQERMLRDDDGGNGNNARISSYSLPYTGLYYIRATRYSGALNDPNTTGVYNLIFNRELNP